MLGRGINSALPQSGAEMGAGRGGMNHALNFRAFAPPRPEPLPAVIALMRCMIRGDGDLLSLLPAEAYRMPIGPLGYSRRSTLIVNRPDLVREVLTDAKGILPKSDLMVHALDPLIGDSIFVSSGATWRRQRASRSSPLPSGKPRSSSTASASG